MALEFEVDPDLNDKLRAEIVACWTDVSNAGGAVGFVPPVTMDDVQRAAERLFAGLLGGRDRLVIARERSGTVDNSRANAESNADRSSAGSNNAGSDTGKAQNGQNAALGNGRLAALAVISDGQFQLTEHWRKVKRVMVHPDFQGRSYGVQLMAAVERVGRDMGLDMLTLDCRGGTGNDEFYKKCGYHEYGRLPNGLRLSADDYRYQVLMVLPLKG